jgi:putative transposase
MDADRRRDVALFRYALVRDLDAMRPRERGRAVRQLAARWHLTPWGERVRVSRVTLDRWRRMWRAGGFEALLPPVREGVPRTPAVVLELAVALKREQTERTAAQITQIIRASEGWAPHERTIQRHFKRIHLNVRPRGRPALGRFEASRANELWVGDAKHGPRIGQRTAILFCFLDDHSRLAVGYRWGLAEDVVRLEAALRMGLMSRGVPEGIYVDNGSPFVSGELLRCCAVLGCRLIHSRPGRPQGRGKVERFFRTVQEEFIVEIAARGGASDLGELNRLFQAWVEHVYHRRVHSETGQAPIERFLAGGAPAVPSEQLVAEAFRWSERRTASAQAIVTMHGNRYELDAALAHQRVELIFDPFDLSRVQVRADGRAAGEAVALEIRRHVHPRARREPAPGEEPTQTGIDFLGLIEARHRARKERRIDYRALEHHDNEQEEDQR